MDLNKLIEDICDEYVRRWKTEGKRYISILDFEQIYAEGNITPIEQESLLIIRLRELNRENPQIPPVISKLPVQILTKLPIYLTKTLEIQVNHDHYEYWAWSAQVFMYLEDTSILLRKLRESNIKHDIIDLLFHICLARINYIPATVEAQVLNRVLDIIVSRHVHHMVSKKFILGAAMAFIALEAVLKTIISEVNEAKEKFEKLRRQKRTLGQVLEIFDKYALPSLSQELQSDIQKLNTIIEDIWKAYGDNWRSIILNWRNNFIHGIKTWIPRAYGVITNYICLLLWHSIPSEQYETKIEELMKHIEWRQKLPEYSRYHEFYPP